MPTRLESLLRKKCGNGVPLQELLAQMDAYDWDSVEDIPVNEEERRTRLRYLNEVIDASGIELNGSILDLACGVASLAYLYPDVVAVDDDPQKIKVLRKDRIKGVVTDIERLPFEGKGFDYVVSISPPQRRIKILQRDERDSYVRFHPDQYYNRRIVDAALRIARKKVLIASLPIALEPPHEHMIEQRSTDGYHYVIYGVNNSNKILGP